MPFLLLSLSVVLSTGRNLLSKKLSGVPFGTGAFFLCQGILFLSGALSLLFFGGLATWSIAPRDGCLRRPLRASAPPCAVALYGGARAGQHRPMLHGLFLGLSSAHPLGGGSLGGALFAP